MHAIVLPASPTNKVILPMYTPGAVAIRGLQQSESSGLSEQNEPEVSPPILQAELVHPSPGGDIEEQLKE